MGILDGSKSTQIKFLEEERKKIWDRLVALESNTKELHDEFLRKTPESVSEAKQNSKKTAEFRNRTEDRLKEASTIVEQLNKELESVRQVKEEINEKSIEAQEAKLSVEETKSQLDDLKTDFIKKVDLLNARIGSIDEILSKYPNLDDKLSEIEDFISTIEENNQKSSVTLSSINKRKKEFDDLHLEIFGYVEIDKETNEEIEVDGLKDKLASTYTELKSQINESTKEIESLNEEYKGKYEVFQKAHQDKYANITSEIEQLLPNALTAGLSAAFSKKKEDEVKSSGQLQKMFNIGIYSLVGVSLIPFATSIYFLIDGLSIDDTLDRIPRIVLAIVPMYIPILWFTYSANKKLNLSKRLIEEYAHKEVLSRTYEGLAKQITSIQDKDQSEELRFRLLSNFLQVSSENPGKLISNYEASDHPVMEALEQSYRFQIAIDKLEGIPGLGKVAAMLERNAKKKVADRTQKIETALAEDAAEKTNGTKNESES